MTLPPPGERPLRHRLKLPQDDRSPERLAELTLRAPGGRNVATIKFERATSQIDRQGRMRQHHVQRPEDGELDTWLERAACDGPHGGDPLIRRLIRACLEALPGKPREVLEAMLEAARGSRRSSPPRVAIGLR